MARILLIVLTFALLIGLSPISTHMSSVQTMQMDETMISYQSNMNHGNAGAIITGSCCDEMASFSIGCAFLVPPCAYVGLSGGSERIGFSTPLIQSIYIQALAPPPKV